MRVTDLSSQTQFLAAVQALQMNVSVTQNQLSSGLAFTDPSQDPVAAGEVNNLNTALSQSQQYQTNANAAQSSLGTEDNTLSQVETQLQNLRDLVLQANSGTNTAQNLSSLASQAVQIQSGLLALANTQDGNGQYIFAGYATQTQPFDQTATGATYAGNQGQQMVQIAAGQTQAPRLEAMLADRNVLKLFHFGRFDMGTLSHAFGVMPEPVYCTKIASKLARTYTDRHGLKDLVRELAGAEISKQQQSSDWGADTLSDAQLTYAASDVLYLHGLRDKLDLMLTREGRDSHARAAFAYLPDRVRLDLAGFELTDIFSHGTP